MFRVRGLCLPADAKYMELFRESDLVENGSRSRVFWKSGKACFECGGIESLAYGCFESRPGGVS